MKREREGKRKKGGRTLVFRTARRSSDITPTCNKGLSKLISLPPFLTSCSESSYSIRRSIQLIQKPLIPRINTIPQHLLHRLQQPLLPLPTPGKVKTHQTDEFFRPVVFYQSGSRTAPTHGETVAGGFGRCIFIGGFDERDDEGLNGFE